MTGSSFITLHNEASFMEYLYFETLLTFIKSSVAYFINLFSLRYLSQLFLIFTVIYLCVYVCASSHMHHSWCLCGGVQGKLVGVGSVLPQCRPLGLNPGHQIWQHVHLFTAASPVPYPRDCF